MFSLRKEDDISSRIHFAARWSAVLLIALSAQGFASDFTLDFGGLQDHEEILNYYDGGLGSLGSGPGPDFNLTFTPSFLAIQATPPYGPPRVGLLNGPSATMDSSDGF